MLDEKKPVACKVLEYFGYSHDCVYLLHSLSRATRKTLADIQNTFKHFFESIQKELHLNRETLAELLGCPLYAWLFKHIVIARVNAK